MKSKARWARWAAGHAARLYSARGSLLGKRARWWALRGTGGALEASTQHTLLRACSTGTENAEATPPRGPHKLFHAAFSLYHLRTVGIRDKTAGSRTLAGSTSPLLSRPHCEASSYVAFPEKVACSGLRGAVWQGRGRTVSSGQASVSPLGLTLTTAHGSRDPFTEGLRPRRWWQRGEVSPDPTSARRYPRASVLRQAGCCTGALPRQESFQSM